MKQIIGDNTTKIKDTLITYGDTVHISAPAIAECSLLIWRITSGTALLLDSTQSICYVILQNGDAEISAFYDCVTPVSNSIRKKPTSFNLRCNENRTIFFSIPVHSNISAIPVNIRIFDIQGRLLGCILNKNMTPGYYNLNLGIQNKMARGIIMCRMESLEYRKTIKISTINLQ